MLSWTRQPIIHSGVQRNLSCPIGTVVPWEEVLYLFILSLVLSDSPCSWNLLNILQIYDTLWVFKTSDGRNSTVFLRLRVIFPTAQVFGTHSALCCIVNCTVKCHQTVNLFSKRRTVLSRFPLLISSWKKLCRQKTGKISIHKYTMM